MKLVAYIARISDDAKDLKGGGGDGTFGDMEARAKRIEDDMTEIRKDIRAILLDTAEIKGKLSNMPSAADFGELKGRVGMLPTTAKVAAILGVIGVIVTIVLK